MVAGAHLVAGCRALAVPLLITLTPASKNQKKQGAGVIFAVFDQTYNAINIL